METNKIYTKNVLVTPEYAKRLLEKNIANRPLGKTIVDWYAYQMKLGQWTVSGQTISISDKDELIDGQHRLHAIIKSGVSLWFTIAYNVPSGSFINYDNLKSRSAKDALAIEKIPNSTNIATMINAYNSIVVNSLSSLGFGFIIGEMSTRGGLRKDKSRFTNKEVLDLYHSNSDLWQEVYKNAASFYKSKPIFKISQLGSIMYYLINDKMHDKAKVFEFFRQLHTNENVTNKTIFYLREKLIDDAMSQYKMIPRMKYVFLVKTWNAYVAGKEFKQFKYSEDDNFIQFA